MRKINRQSKFFNQDNIVKYVVKFILKFWASNTRKRHVMPYKIIHVNQIVYTLLEWVKTNVIKIHKNLDSFQAK